MTNLLWAFDGCLCAQRSGREVTLLQLQEKKKKKSADNKNYNCVNSVSVLLKAKANSKPKTGFHASPLKQG